MEVSNSSGSSDSSCNIVLGVELNDDNTFWRR